jgi:hypothetical protein
MKFLIFLFLLVSVSCMIHKHAKEKKTICVHVYPGKTTKPFSDGNESISPNSPKTDETPANEYQNPKDEEKVVEQSNPPFVSENPLPQVPKEASSSDQTKEPSSPQPTPQRKPRKKFPHPAPDTFHYPGTDLPPSNPPKHKVPPDPLLNKEVDSNDVDTSKNDSKALKNEDNPLDVKTVKESVSIKK